MPRGLRALRERITGHSVARCKPLPPDPNPLATTHVLPLRLVEPGIKGHEGEQASEQKTAMVHYLTQRINDDLPIMLTTLLERLRNERHDELASKTAENH